MTLAAARPVLAAPGDVVTVDPRVINDVLPNPGMGWQTFHSFAGDAVNRDGPPSAAAYFRFTWRELEPERGAIRFELLDALLARAHAAGQRLSFRVYCADTDQQPLSVPDWLKAGGCAGTTYRYEGGAMEYWVPDMADARFQEAHLAFIAALGRRYDGHPDLDLLDIGSVGLWGEWHYSGTGVPMPPVPIQRTLIAAWVSAFPRTPKVVNVDSDQGMTLAATLGLGWRADCLGDYGMFSKTWSHMNDKYRQTVTAFGDAELWQQAPVAFEMCGDLRDVAKNGWSARATFDYALDLHASYINNKSAPIPTGMRSEIDRMLRRLGYRLVLTRLLHPGLAARGGIFPVRTTWRNEGVAPPYGPWKLAVRLTRVAGGEPLIVTGTSVRGWLPGSETEVTDPIRVPVTCAPGEYALAIGVVEPASRLPAVRLAIAGRDAAGWYPLSRISVR